MEEMYENALRASQFLKLLANENRLIILCSLAEGEKNMSELGELLGIRQPTLSQQPARLRKDEVVTTRRYARQIYYSLASEEVRQVMGLMYELFSSEGTAQEGRQRRLTQKDETGYPRAV